MTDKIRIEIVKKLGSLFLWKPLDFIQKVLNIKLIWSGQKRVIESLVKNKITVVPTGHSIGKTALASFSTMWWLSTRINSRVIVIAPTHRQLMNVFYAELQKWYNQSDLKEFELFDIKAHMMNVDVEDYKKGWYMLPIAPKTPDALQGSHGDKTGDIEEVMKEMGVEYLDTDEDIEIAVKLLKNISKEDTISDNILVILDESSGIADKLIEVIEGIDPTRILCLGNMTKTDGFFYDWAYRKKDKDIKVITLSSFDSPFMSQAQIDSMIRRYGIDSDVINVRLRGLPPTGNNNSIISKSLLEKNTGEQRDIENVSIGGLDVARFGDDKTIFYVDYKLEAELQQKSTMEGCGYIAKWCRINIHSRKILCVDVVGIGSGVVDRLNEILNEDYELKLEEKRCPGLEIIEINNGKKPYFNKLEYADLITEMFYYLRTDLENGSIKIPNDDELIEDLSSRAYKFTSDGKIKAESKDEFKKRIGRSCDKGDAFLMMNFAKNWI